MNRWSKAELDLIEHYFKTTITEMTLFQHLQELNPLRSYEAMTRMIRRMRIKGLYRPRDRIFNNLRIGFLDIESSDLNADIGIMLSWCIKPLNKSKIESDCITQKEILNFSHDKRILMSLLKAFDNYDLLITQYGTDRKFDIPFIRTRAYRHKVEYMLPSYMERLMGDTWLTARNKLKLHNNRLDSIANVMGIKIAKTPLDPHIWELARSGHKQSLDYILQHNKNDVLILEQVYKKLKMVESKAIYKSI